MVKLLVASAQSALEGSVISPLLIDEEPNWNCVLSRTPPAAVVVPWAAELSSVVATRRSEEVSRHQTRMVRINRSFSLRKARGWAARSDHPQADEKSNRRKF